MAALSTRRRCTELAGTIGANNHTFPKIKKTVHILTGKQKKLEENSRKDFLI
jgi:hypothetical protein